MTTGDDLARLKHTVSSQRGMLRQQGDEIATLRRCVKALEGTVRSQERTNGRLAADWADSRVVLWMAAGIDAQAPAHALRANVGRVQERARVAIASRIKRGHDA